MDSVQFQPIGVFHCRERHPYDAARQGALTPANAGEVRLLPGRNYEQALRDLEGFSRIWLLYVFHHNRDWKPMVRPPRGDRKVGVFACRAPYRPNPIGLSCVELAGVDGLTLRIRGHDLLDGTPVLDIKPYVPYADSFPEARTGWLAAAEAAAAPWQVAEAEPAATQLAWLEAHGVGCMQPFVMQQLAVSPLDGTRKRLRHLGEDSWEIAYRTWRAAFAADAAARRITVIRVYSGYSSAALLSAADRYGDKEVHRAFTRVFGAGGGAAGAG